MRRYTAALFVLALSSVTTRDAAAQPDTKDVTAYFALNSTHVGALNPMMAPMSDRSGLNSFAVRLARHSPEGTGGEADNILGATGFFKAGQNAIVSATLGYNMIGCPTGATCDNGLMLGGDIQSSLWKSAGNTPTSMNVNITGSLGWAKYGDMSALGGAVGVPLGMSMEQASKSRISFFVTPGFGWGRLSDGTDSESGTRPMFGLGGAFATPSGWAFNAGFQKVMIEDGTSNIGIGFSKNLQ